MPTAKAWKAWKRTFLRYILLLINFIFSLLIIYSVFQVIYSIFFIEVLLQGSFHAHPPGVEGFGGELKLIDQLDDVGNRHTIAQNAGDELGIVPILGIELLAQSFDSNLVATLVDKLEIISLLSFQ